MSTRFAWFITPRGRKLIRGLASVTAVGVFSIHYLPHTLFLDRYHDLVTLRRDKLLSIDSRHGKSFPLTPDLETRYRKALDDINLTDFHKDLLKPFMVSGYDVWHAGSLHFQNGALIGLPINFTYKKAEDIDKTGIIIDDDHVNWNRKEAQSLLQALVLSEYAQKFAIAREAFMVQNHNALIQSITASFLFCLFCGLSSSLNDKMNLFEKPRFFRIIFYGLLGSFIWGIWVMQKDGFTKFYEYEADENASNISIDYTKGGLEYYNKVIQRNIALRALSGLNGEKMFTQGGNHKITFREKHIPNTSRKQFFEEKLKEYEGKKVKVVVQNDTVAA